jgi:hypothetical protein
VNDWILLIDFGTSFTRAAIADQDGRIVPIELDGALTIPSGVWAESSGKLVAGISAQRQAELAPERWDRAPGRSLGLGEPLILGQIAVDPVKAVAEVLRRVGAEATRRRGSKPTDVRLTCSPRWNSTRRAALLEAAKLAGLGASPAVPPELVDYPVAAALQLARLGRFDVGSKVALFGLGGGSAETAILESTATGVVVRALGGIAGVGGEQFDDLLFRKVVAHKLKSTDVQLAGRVWEPPDAEWRRASEHLFREVRRAKEELSQQRNVDLDTGPLINVPLELSRIELESVLRAEILRSARELGTTIELAGLRARQLDGILLTGGSVRIPLVTRAVFDVIGVHPEVLTEESIDSALYLGAAFWKPSIRVGPNPAPLTVAGGQTREEAAADAAAAAAALAATGSIDLSALTPPRPAIAGSTDSATSTALRAGVKRAGLSAWRRRWPVIVAVAAVLVVAGFVLNGPASGDDEAGPAGLAPTGQTQPGPDQTTAVDALGGAKLPPVTGLSVQTRNISIDLTWDNVPGATAYAVYRDAGTPDQTVRSVPRTTFTDRPGDADQHQYSVVAVDETAQQGPPSAQVSAEAEAPYGELQPIASAWTAVVPITPGKKGTAGQTCKGSATDSEYSNGQIRCTFGNGVRLVILSYPSSDERDKRADQLADLKRVSTSKWGAAQREGTRYSGQLLTASSKAADGPWRWWTYDAASTYAIRADWPKHSAKQLSSWWDQKAPFRS